MVKTREELIASLKERMGEELSDENISLLEDVTDTLDDYHRIIQGVTDWEKKYQENDEMWRKKYTERFSEPQQHYEKENVSRETLEVPKTFEDLFE